MKDMLFEYLDKIDELKSLCRQYTKTTEQTATYTQDIWYRMYDNKITECEEWSAMTFNGTTVSDSIAETTLDGVIEFMKEAIESEK